MMRARARRGFTLLEVVFAVVIMATALVALQASIAGCILSAETSVNRRAARECCRAKLEEILAGVTPPDGGGDIPDRPGFKWNARSEELRVGVGETQTEVARVVTVEMTFPVNSVRQAEGASTAGDSESETIKLSSVLPEPPAQAQPAPGGGPR